MKTAVIFFSYSGKTGKLARAYAQEHGADIYEVAYKKKPGIIGAFLSCPGAVAQKSAKNLEPFSIDYAQYDEVTVMGPIWAGFPAPPVNTIIRSLPQGMKVRLRMVSASSGTRDKAKVTGLAEAQGCSVIEYEDIRLRA